MVEKWGCSERAKGGKSLVKFRLYSYFIFYDFEALFGKNEKALIKDLVYEAIYTSVLVSVADTLNKNLTFLCEKDSKKLMESYMKEIISRG